MAGWRRGRLWIVVSAVGLISWMYLGWSGEEGEHVTYWVGGVVVLSVAG